METQAAQAVPGSAAKYLELQCRYQCMPALRAMAGCVSSPAVSPHARFRDYSPPSVDRIWGRWGSYSKYPKPISIYLRGTIENHDFWSCRLFWVSLGFKGLGFFAGSMFTGPWTCAFFFFSHTSVSSQKSALMQGHGCPNPKP